MKKKVALSLLSLTFLLFSGCMVNVSFTGGTIDPAAKTVFIGTFVNNSSLVNPSLSQDFTNALKTKIQSQTPLEIVNSGGDYRFEGEITNYTINPTAIQGNETAAMNRLTITVRVSFENKFDEDLNFQHSFSSYADYRSDLNLSSIESSLVEEINDALTDEIYNKAFVNW